MILTIAKILLPSFLVAFLLPVSMKWGVSRRAWDRDNAGLLNVERWSLSFALSLGMLLGVTLVREELALPNRFWHWLQVIALVTAAMSPLVAAFPNRLRVIAWIVVGSLAAWLLVPTWANLQPSRKILVPALGCYYVLLQWGYAHLSRHCPSTRLIAISAVTAAILAISIAYNASLTYGLLAAVLCAGLTGNWMYLVFVAGKTEEILAVDSSIAILTTSVAFVGYVYPQPPLYWVLLLPAIPLSLLAARGAAA